jgi:hypothetical protein
MSDFVLPSSTQRTAADLAKEGGHFAFARLTQGAEDRLLLLAADQATLAPGGFGPDWQAAIQQQIDGLRAQQGAHDVTAADHAHADAEATTFHALSEWVKDFDTAVELAGPATSDHAPHPKRGWNSPAHIKESVPGLVTFAATHAFGFEGATSAALAARGQAALDAFTAAQKAHTAHAAALGPTAVAFRAQKGLVAFELARLAKLAKRRLPRDRAAKYSLAALRGDGRGAQGKATAPQGGTPAPVSPAK